VNKKPRGKSQKKSSNRLVSPSPNHNAPPAVRSTRSSNTQGLLSGGSIAQPVKKVQKVTLLNALIRYQAGRIREKPRLTQEQCAKSINVAPFSECSSASFSRYAKIS
jgi:hypothetical protein